MDVEGCGRGLKKVLYRYFPGGTENNHEKPQPVQQVSGPKFEAGTFRIRSTSVNPLTATFGNCITIGFRRLLAFMKIAYRPI
jgi:hypothetical protein